MSLRSILSKEANMAKKITTLFIEDTVLRLMVADGKRILNWVELRFQPGLLQNSTVIDETEFVAIIKQLFWGQKVKTKNIKLGISGLQCLSRPLLLPELPKEMLDEAVRREAKRLLPVSLEQFYLSWQIIPAPQGKSQVFLVAIPRKTVDTLLRALRQAGLTPSFLGIKPMLLAKLVKEATAVIVDVHATEFDIVVIAEGIPQPIRTLRFANEALSWQEKLAMIRNDLDRTIKFYDSNNIDKPLTPSVPIFASGDLANELELFQTLSDEIGHPVSLLLSPLDYSPEFDAIHYMANIGLAVQNFSNGQYRKPSVTNMNALPIPYQAKSMSLPHIFGLSFTTIACGLLVFLVMLTRSTAADIASIQSESSKIQQLLQQELSQKKELEASISTLQNKLNAIKASSDNLGSALGSLEKQSIGISRDIETSVLCLPSTMSLTDINHSNNTLTVSGLAPSKADVLSYIEKLDKSGRFGGITITNINQTKGDKMAFTLVGILQTSNRKAGSIGVVMSNLPATISLTSISSTNDVFTVNGRSPNEDEILSYLKKLEASGIFRAVSVTSMMKNNDQGIDFSLTLWISE